MVNLKQIIVFQQSEISQYRTKSSAYYEPTSHPDSQFLRRLTIESPRVYMISKSTVGAITSLSLVEQLEL
jgi:hypothetical protein